MSTRALPVLLAVFSALFGVIYLIVMDHNWAAFTYHPRPGEWGLGAEAARNGPAMYFYGWMTTALAATAVGCLLGLAVRRRLPATWWLHLGWLAPIGATVGAVYLMSPFFLR